jgi:hypothetical protein
MVSPQKKMQMQTKRLIFSFLFFVFTNASAHFNAGDNIEYIDTCGTEVDLFSVYKDIFHIDSVSYTIADTNYFFKRIVINIYNSGPGINGSQNDTTLVKHGNFKNAIRNVIGYFSPWDTNAVFQIPDNPKIGDTVFIPGISLQTNTQSTTQIIAYSNTVFDTIILNKDTNIFIDGYPCEELLGGRLWNLGGGPWAYSKVLGLFYSQKYGILNFEYHQGCPHDYCSYSYTKRLVKINGQVPVIQRKNIKHRQNKLLKSGLKSYYLANGRMLPSRKLKVGKLSNFLIHSKH